MLSTFQVTFIPLLFLFLARTILSITPAATVYSGVPYLISTANAGDGYYLGCGTDCNIIDIANAHYHDAWTIVDVDSYWTFQSFVDHQWALDVESNGYNVFGYTITNASAQLWTLYALPEDSTTTHQFYSGAWSKSMNVDSNNAVFMDSQSKGQAWYFREVEPQTTVTSTTTSTYVQHATTTVTATTTITTCVVQGLGKRDATGSDLLSTTTHTNWITQTVTDTQTDATQTFTSTNTVFSCKPTTVVSTQPGSTIVSISTQPGTTVVSVSMDTGPSATNKGSSSSATGSTGGSSTPSSTPSSASTYRAPSSFRVSALGWTSALCVIVMTFIFF